MTGERPTAAPGPPPPEGPSPEVLAANQAHKRAMPLQRLLGNGMDWADAVELYARADRGETWHRAAFALGLRDAERADSALAAGHRRTARDWYLAAAACHRFGQVPLPDSDPDKILLYRHLIDAFGRAGALYDPPAERMAVPWGGGQLRGWLLRPRTAHPPPTVIVVGGFDGWREEYHSGAVHLLDRGVAVLLAEAPGQGETRLFTGLHLGPDFTGAFSAMVTWIGGNHALGDRVGVWGNSMGGFLAAAAAIDDHRIEACCVNGGTTTPVEFPRRYPRMAEKARLLLGAADTGRALKALAELRLRPAGLSRLTCPLLVLHGTPDRVFRVENARALYAGAASQDKTWHEWPDGDHCLYNHSLEKHTLVADWFADRLAAHTALSSSRRTDESRAPHAHRQPR
ncbi:alpha/beta hydrolase [Streptomyces albiaxialis]|uniref:Alpha/beta hydrolase n=1 Tax=Streptomyces albiaxialis TaxID=329523 RepID=A0ABP5I5M6_9ACTN